MTGRIAAFSLGSSMGDRLGALRLAARALQRLPRTRSLMASRIYGTAPVGGVARRPFLNAVVCVYTELDVATLAAAILRIERRAGRRTARRWADRRLDIDLLLLGDEVHERPLEVPHPRLRERPFLILALREAWPEAAALRALPVGATRPPPVVGVLPRDTRR